METILINLYLISFWLDKSVGFHLEEKLGLGPGFSLPNLCLYAMICFWGINYRDRPTLFQNTNVNRYLFILMILTLFSILTNYFGHANLKVSLFEYIVEYKILITPWLLFFVINSLVKDRNTCDKLIKSLSIFFIATVLAVLLETTFGFEFGTKGTGKAYQGRSFGFSEANQYAGFLVLIIPIYMAAIVFHNEWSKKLSGYIHLLIGVFGMLSAASKGGFISLFISATYFFRKNIKNNMINLKYALFSICMIILFLCGSYYLLTDKSKEIVIKRFTMKEEYKNKWEKEYLKKQSFAWKLTSGRTQIWGKTIKLIKKKPVYGYGYGADSNKFKLSTHSDPLKWLLNNGAIGFILYLIVYIQIYRHVFYNYSTTKELENKRIYIGYLTGFMGYTIAMIGVNMYEPRYIFWIYTALIYSYTNMDDVEDKAQLKATMA